MSLAKFDRLMSHLNSEENEMAAEFRKELESLVEDSEWLSCLEAAGVDNWGGIDHAHSLRDGEDDDE